MQLSEQLLLAKPEMPDQEQLTQNDQGVKQNDQKIQVEPQTVVEAKVLKLQPPEY